MTDIPNIEEVIELLGIEKSPKAKPGASSYMVRCPFCGNGGSNDYHMSINTKLNAYHCFKCGGGEKGTGTLDLYARVRFGERHTKGPSGNGKKLLNSLMNELGSSAARQYRSSVYRAAPVEPPAPSVRAALDVKLDAAFSAMLALPCLKLSAQHRENLRRRGMDDTSIDRNGYATMPHNASWAKAFPAISELYDRERLGEEKDKFGKLQNTPRNYILAGLYLAEQLISKGIKLKGVPGAFLLKGHWCMMYTPGMLIPTRNIKGEIVALQTRTDRGNLRYLTYSASGLPYAVSSNISRTHFPLGNAAPKEASEVLITEGPLKADIAVSLYEVPVFFIAIHGVSNTKELNTIFRSLAMDGVPCVNNALDMDKILNTNVRKQSRDICRKARNAGLQMVQKVWDRDYAHQKLAEVKAVCDKNGIPVIPCSEPFVQLSQMADSLANANIPFCRVMREGKWETDYWRPETKGIDDYLLYLKKIG